VRSGGLRCVTGDPPAGLPGVPRSRASRSRRRPDPGRWPAALPAGGNGSATPPCHRLAHSPRWIAVHRTGLALPYSLDAELPARKRLRASAAAGPNDSRPRPPHGHVPRLLQGRVLGPGV